MEKHWLGRAFLGRETRTTTTGNPAVEAEFSLQRLAFRMLRAIDVDLLWLGVLGSASRTSAHSDVILYYFWAYVLFLALSWLTPMADHMVDLLQAPEQLKAMGAKARIRAEERFSLMRGVQNTMDLLSMLAQPRNHQRHLTLSDAKAALNPAPLRQG